MRGVGWIPHRAWGHSPKASDPSTLKRQFWEMVRVSSGKDMLLVK